MGRAALSRPRPHLGVGGPVDDLSLPQPDDGGCRLGIVCVAGEVEGVPRPQADHRPPQNDGVIGWHCGERNREVRLRAPLSSGRAGRLGWVGFTERMMNSNYHTLIKCIIPCITATAITPDMCIACLFAEDVHITISSGAHSKPRRDRAGITSFVSHI